MSEVQWAALTGFALGILVGAGIMTVIKRQQFLHYIRGIMIAALKAEGYTLEQYIEEEIPPRE